MLQQVGARGNHIRSYTAQHNEFSLAMELTVFLFLPVISALDCVAFFKFSASVKFNYSLSCGIACCLIMLTKQLSTIQLENRFIKTVVLNF